MEQPDFQDWVGREESVDDTVSLGAARRMAAFLDHDPGVLKNGSNVPAHWFAMVCTPFDVQSRLGDNGHVHGGEFMPPVTLGRRNLGGRRVECFQPMRIGQEIVRTSRITAIVHKTGRAGRMCIVTVRNEYRQQDSGLTVTDEQDVIFSEGLARQGVPQVQAQAQAAVKEANDDTVATAGFLPDARMLFRFSALTFNAFRVHYDAPYATEVERLPGLVVNGSLTTLKVWDFATRRSGMALKSSISRNLLPLHAGNPVVIELKESGNGSFTARAGTSAGVTAVQVELQLV